VALELAAPLRDSDATFHQHGAQLVHQCGPFADQPVADTMEGLHVKLPAGKPGAHAFALKLRLNI